MTRRALGWYETDATDEEKGRALRICIVECAAELGEMGFSRWDMEDLLEEADGAHEETYNMRGEE